MKTLNEHRFGRGMRGKELILGYTPKLITALRKKVLCDIILENFGDGVLGRNCCSKI